ncbi:uncharacterized protein [Rhodnius prolixus]|uniref:Uncharacterized protein n=1 Tax=Rhodnius prolixus TaxID=13249 RepID=T1HVV4_RHOPR
MKQKQELLEDDQSRQPKALKSKQKNEKLRPTKLPQLQSDLTEGERASGKSEPIKSTADGGGGGDADTATSETLPTANEEIPDGKLPGEWELDVKGYEYAQPGCFGFNGHQVIFHCYEPGKPYRARNASTDACLLKLGNLETGEQACTIAYDKPPPPPPMPKRRVCKTDRQTNVTPQDFCMKKPEAVTKSTEMEAALPAQQADDTESVKKKGKEKAKKGGAKKKK